MLGYLLAQQGGKKMYLDTVICTYSDRLADYAKEGQIRFSLAINALFHAHTVWRPKRYDLPLGSRERVHFTSSLESIVSR